MQEYLDIVNKVLKHGKEKKPVRKNHFTGKWEPVDGGISTLACANVLFSHEMSMGFPLLTTKHMAWKTIRVELEGFIKGITDKRWYQERGCKIWNEWANPQKVQDELGRIENEWTMACEGALGCGPEEQPEPLPDDLTLKKMVQKDLFDLGPIYGYQWRYFDRHYTDKVENPEEWLLDYKHNPNGVFAGVDQLDSIVDKIKNNPMDRRMVCSAWNPNQIQLMALPPCHYAWNVTIIGDELNLFWAQRSCDLMLGVPFNIASYALLLLLLAKTGGFKPGNLSGMLVDCHIYENQIEAAKIQVTREPRPLPTVEIIGDEDFDIFNWEHNDIKVSGYNPHPKLDFGAVAV